MLRFYLRQRTRWHEEPSMYNKNRLIEIVREKSLEFGDFTLASGKKANYYLDCRKVTLDSEGALLIAEGILDMLGDDLPDAVGGMAIGADPITGAVITSAAIRGRRLKGFIVRKEAKTHGKGRNVEGPVVSGETVVVVEDVVTTGGSALKAIERVEQFGLKVQEVIGVVDRMEGGLEAFDQRGYNLRTLLSIRDFGIEPPSE
jgi:orotate phosphoribosyltransferase